MEASVFDRLARNVGTVSSRRWVLGLLATIGPAGVLSLLDSEEAQARRRHGCNRRHNPGKRKRNRKGKRKGGKAGTGLPCGPENCGGCCNESGCVPGFDQSNQACGLGGITCAVCPAVFFCQDGTCTCINPGGFCDPTARPDQCCNFEPTTCNTGPSQPSGICCLVDGAPCMATANTPCIPGSGCCCSGVCGGDNTCTSSS